MTPVSDGLDRGAVVVPDGAVVGQTDVGRLSQAEGQGEPRVGVVGQATRGLLQLYASGWTQASDPYCRLGKETHVFMNLMMTIGCFKF